MYLRYAESPNLSEEELKRAIVATLRDLLENWPEHFQGDYSVIPAETDETQLFIHKLGELPLLKSVRERILAGVPRNSLVMAFRFISIFDWVCEIEIRLLALSSLSFTSQWLGIRYAVAAEFIEKVLHEDLRYDYDLICDALMNPYDDLKPDVAENSEWAAIAEIERVLANENTRDEFLDLVNRFEDNAEAQIKKAIPVLIQEIAFRMMTESIMASADIIDSVLDTGGDLDMKYFGEIMNGLLRKGRRFTNERLGIRRGGPRKTKKFVWTDERKREFYEKTSSFVHTNGKPLWEYAHAELVEKDFSLRIIGLLRNDTALKSVSNTLWDRAVKAWKGSATDFISLKASETPQSFAMFHAIELLNYPKTTFSTLKKYFGQGKKLSAINNGI